MIPQMPPRVPERDAPSETLCPLQETGREALSLCALQDGSSFVCPACGGVVARARAAHHGLWCTAAPRRAGPGTRLNGAAPGWDEDEEDGAAVVRRHSAAHAPSAAAGAGPPADHGVADMEQG